MAYQFRICACHDGQITTLSRPSSHSWRSPSRVRLMLSNVSSNFVAIQVEQIKKMLDLKKQGMYLEFMLY